MKSSSIYDRHIIDVPKFKYSLYCIYNSLHSQKVAI